MAPPGTGCQTCKLRRIKCDGMTPTCNRCTQSRRICVSRASAKEATFSIHLENLYASGAIKRPRGPRSSTIPPAVTIDIQTRALAYYLNFHLQAVIDVPKISAGLEECVTEWNRAGRTCPMVDLAVSSRALVVFARAQRYQPARQEADVKYARLIGVTRGRIAELAKLPTADEGIVDACLLAVSLMGQNEGDCHQSTIIQLNKLLDSPQSWPHHYGALAILKAWFDYKKPGAATFIIKQARRWLINSCFIRKLSLPEWLQDGELFGETGGELEYDRIITRVINLHHQISNTQEEKGANIKEAERLNIQAQDLDAALKEWITQIPICCSPKSHILQDLPDPETVLGKHFYSSRVHNYPTPANAAAWSQYYAIRMLVTSDRLKALSILPKQCTHINRQQEECIHQLQTLADDLAANVPFCLGIVTLSPGTASLELNLNDNIKPYLAHMVAWPVLSITSTIEGINEPQRVWFKEELARLVEITGEYAGIEG